jgi:hypothetical protein
MPEKSLNFPLHSVEVGYLSGGLLQIGYRVGITSTLLNQVLYFRLSKSSFRFLCLFLIASHIPCEVSSLLISERAMTSLTSGHESKGQSTCSSIRACSM